MIVARYGTIGWRVVKTQARAGKAWDYVDPSKTADEVQKLAEPKMPKPFGIKQGAETSVDLSEDEVKRLQQLQSPVKPQRKKFELKGKALNELVKHIQETVSTTYISWTYDCDTVYDMLVALQKRLKPKKNVRRRELIDKLIKLRDHPKTRQIDEWLHEYEKTYKEGVKEKIPDFDREYMVQGFLQATSKLNPEFATYYEMTLIRHPEEELDLYDLVDAFRHHRALRSLRDEESIDLFAMRGVMLDGQPEVEMPTTNEKEEKEKA